MQQLVHWLATFCKYTLPMQVCSLGTASMTEHKTQVTEEYCPYKKDSAELWAAWTDFTSFSHRFVCMYIHRNTHSTAKGTHN